MSGGPRAYTTQTLKRLFALSGNECAFPGCAKPVIENGAAKTSNICHIAGANDTGQRYDPLMSNAERAHFDNLIILCVQHHTETDNVDKYPTEELQQMKQAHEAAQSRKKSSNNPSLLVTAVNAIITIAHKGEASNGPENAFNPRAKIEHNGLVLYRFVVEEYKIFHTRLESIYFEIDAIDPNRKDRLLMYIKHLYLVSLGELCASQGTVDPEEIEGDEVFAAVIDALTKDLSESQHYNEDVIIGATIIAVDAFIRCQLLSEPSAT